MATKKNDLPDKSQKNKIRKEREIDKLVNETRSSWKDSMVFISKKKVATWKAIFVVAFAAGIAAAIIISVYSNIQSQSGADGGANLDLEALDEIVSLENTDGKNLVYVEVSLDSHENDVVAVKAEVNYDPEYLELIRWNTADSIFATDDNTCIYNNKPCEIVNNDKANGKISIIEAKPSPGVNSSSGSASGIIASLTFKALKVTNPSSPTNITLSYTPGSYEDSDVISDDGLGTDILSSVTNDTVSIYNTICTSFTYEPTQPCQSDNTQDIKVISSIPEGCGGGYPDLAQDCVYNKDAVPCTDKFTYTDWDACQSGGKQYRTETSRTPAGCSGGEEPKLTQSCEYIPAKDASASSCTSFTYSDWDKCRSNEKQSRTVTSSTPAGCSGGVSPQLTQSCEYEKKDKEDPKITDLPLFLKKHRGEKIWWKATDNKSIDYYTYNFDGKKVKTTRKHFFLPVSTSRGIHMLRLKAFDKAGNSKSRLVTILIY
jgi:hypothetical protein